MYGIGFLLFPFFANFLIPAAHPSLALCGPDRDENYRPSLRSKIVGVMTALDDVNGTICHMLRYDQSLELTLNGDLGPSISCLTHGQCIGLAVSSVSSGFVSNSPNIQLLAEASFISSISVIVVLIWIGVFSISLYVSLLFDDI